MIISKDWTTDERNLLISELQRRLIKGNLTSLQALDIQDRISFAASQFIQVLLRESAEVFRFVARRSSAEARSGAPAATISAPASRPTGENLNFNPETFKER